MNLYFKDHNYAVREQAIKSLVATRHFIGNELYYELVERYLSQMA